jgi:1-acyl-sn-glycerol-3-phosphate acyltransferase
MPARLLTRLGAPKLWGDDPDRLWAYMRYFIQPATLLLAPAAAYGVDRVPTSGGAVLAVNHFSGIDHPLIGCFCPRPVVYLAKAELLKIPVFGELLTWTGIVFVRRGEGDREALRRAREVVRNGGLIGMHVEGTRQRLGYPGRIHAGGLMIAMHEQAPIVPCGLDTFRWSPINRRRCAVVFGEPFTLDELPRNREGYARAAEIVGGELVRLWRLAAEAAAAGLPELLPDGSRRSGPIPPGWSPEGAGPPAVSH